MKKTLAILTMLAAFLPSYAEEGTAYLSFDRKIHNLGKIERGMIATDTVRITNTGSEPLMILKVSADCNCTTTDYTKDPIPPGGMGFISVEFDSKNKELGKFRRNVRVKSNAKNRREIFFIDGTIVTAN